MCQCGISLQPNYARAAKKKHMFLLLPLRRWTLLVVLVTLESLESQEVESQQKSYPGGMVHVGSVWKLDD